jgi:hypothetical protein
MKKYLILLPVLDPLRMALLGMVCLATAPMTAAGQNPVGVCKDARGCDSGSDSGSDGASGPGLLGPTLGWVGCKVFGAGSGCPDKNDARLSAAWEQNNKGLEAGNKGDWTLALSYFQKALKNHPDSQVIARNIAISEAWIVELSRVEAEKRAAAQSKVAADKMQQSIRDFAKTLKTAPSTGGLDFDGGSSGTAPGGGNSGGLDFTTAIETPNSPAGDPMVVDARKAPSGLPKAVDDAITGAYRAAPDGVADRVRKGFQAVNEGDWNVAMAWFKDALNRDPGNAGLKRLVELTAAAPPQAGKPPTGGAALQLPTDADAEFLFPGEIPSRPESEIPSRPTRVNLPTDVLYYVPSKGTYRMTLSEARVRVMFDQMTGGPVSGIIPLLKPDSPFYLTSPELR